MPKPALRLHQLLGTKDERQQVQMVQALAAPTIVLTIALCPFDGQVQLHAMTDHGGPVAPEVVYYMLDEARKLALATERDQKLKQTPAPAPEPPSAPPAPTPATDAPPKAETSLGRPILETAPEPNGHK